MREGSPCEGGEFRGSARGEGEGLRLVGWPR